MAITYHAGRRIQGARGAEELASTGWTMVSGMTLTSGTGIVVDTSSNHQSSYDLGASGALTPNDSWVCDWDITRNSGDNNNHPSLMFKSANTNYHDTTVNGENQVLLHYPANGNTGNSSGILATHVQFHISNSQYEVGTDPTYCQDVGTTLYYRMYMSKGGAAGDGIRFIRRSAWTSDALRTAEGSTGREVDSVSTSAVNSGWSSTDALRYVIVINKNSNQANWTLSNFKFWNGVASSGVADNMLSHTPTINLNFTDGYAGDTKPTNVQVGSRYEETDTRKMYHYNAPTLTFEDDFSSDTWTGCKNNACDSGAPTTVTISGGDLSAVSVNVASDDRMVKALGLTLSNTAWIYQFETNVSSTGTHTGLVGLVSSGGNMNNTSILCDYNGSNKIIMREYNSGLTEMGSGISISTGTQYYVTVIRTSLTGLTLEVRTGSHTGSHVSGSPESGTITGATGLTHVQSGAYGRGSGTATYDIDNIEIYNGVTSTDNAWDEEGT